MNADPYCSGNSGIKPLHIAAKKGYLEIINLFAVYDIDFDQQDDCGRTPMHFAAAYGRVKAASALYELGADPNPIDDDVSFYYLMFYFQI